MKIQYKKILDYISQNGKEKIFWVLGIVGIMMIFIGDINIGNNKEPDNSENLSLKQYRQQIEADLITVLKEIDGVGDVKLMVTFESGEENIYAQQEHKKEDIETEHNDDKQQETSQITYENEIVIIEKSGSDVPIVEKTMQPIVQGVAVVCTGADNIKVVSDVTNTVSVVLGVPTHKIFVTKMR